MVLQRPGRAGRELRARRAPGARHRGRAADQRQDGQHQRQADRLATWKTASPIALTPLLIEGRAENLAAENLHRLSELARLNGHELDAQTDENGDTVYDTDELIRAVSGAKVWVQLGDRFNEYSRRSVNTLDAVIEPVSAEELATLAADRTTSSG